MQLRIARSGVGNLILVLQLLVLALLASSALMYDRLASQPTSGTSSPTQDWTSFIFDNNNSRYQANSTVTSGNVNSLTLKWMFPTYYSVTSTPLVENGIVYFADWGGNVYAVNLANGNLVWKTNVGFPISSTPLLVNGLLYLGGGPAGPTKVLALDQTNGNVVWTYTFHSTMNAIWASPVVYSGRLYIGLASTGSASDESNTALAGEVDALDAATGGFLWRFQTMIGGSGGAAVWGSVVPDPSLNSVYFGTGNAFGSSQSSLYAYSVISLNAATGALNWYFQAYPNLSQGQDLDFGSTPNLFSLQFGGLSYNAIGLGAKDGAYYVLDRTNGKLIVRYSVGVSGGDNINGIIGLPGFVYPSTPKVNPEVFIPTQYYQQGLLAALFPSSGTYGWKYFTNGIMTGSVAIAPGVVFAGDGDGYLYAVSSVDGSLLYKTGVFGSLDGGITVAEGCVLFGNDVYPPPPGGDSRLGLYVFAPSTTSSTTTSLTTSSTTVVTTSSSTSISSTSSSSANGYGVTSVSWGYAPTSVTPGAYAQWQAQVFTAPTAVGSGIPITWYLDGVVAYSTVTGGGCCGPNSGASYFGTTLGSGPHVLSFVAGGYASSVLNICAGSCSATTTTTSTSTSSSSSSTSSSSTSTSSSTTGTEFTVLSASGGQTGGTASIGSNLATSSGPRTIHFDVLDSNGVLVASATSERGWNPGEIINEPATWSALGAGSYTLKVYVTDYQSSNVVSNVLAQAFTV